MGLFKKLLGRQRPGTMSSRTLSLRMDGGKPATLNEEARSVEVVGATEAVVPVWDWERWDVIPEVLLMSGAHLPENGQLPLLDTHDTCDGTSSVIGSFRNVRIEESTDGKRMVGAAVFSSLPEGDRPFVKLREGHLTDFSVGYIVQTYSWIEKGETATIEGRGFTGPVRVVTEWSPREMSICPVGADSAAKARSAKSTKENKMLLFGKREDTPTEDPAVCPFLDGTSCGAPAGPVCTYKDADGNCTKSPADAAAGTETPATEPEPASEPDGAMEEPDDRGCAPDKKRSETDSERSRVRGILAICKEHGLSERAADWVSTGASLDRVRFEALSILSARRGTNAPGYGVGQSSAEKFRSAAADALLMRGHSVVKKPAPGADELRGYSLLELAREALRQSGQRVPGDPMSLVGRALTTSDLPYVLGEVVRRRVDQGVEEAAETYAQWTGESDAQDFRDHVGISLDAVSTLTRVNESAEYKYSSVSDTGVPYSVATYGSIIPISRQAIVNNDLGILSDTPVMMGRAAERTVGDLVYGILTSTANLSDGKPLFHTSRKNLAATGTALTPDAFGLAVVAMGTQKGKRGETLNLAPKYLLVPYAHMQEALSVIGSEYIGSQEQPLVRNPWAVRGYEVVVEARLDPSTGTAPWFAAAMKGLAINVAWLGGQKAPRIEQRDGWTVDGVELKVSIDAGAYIRDPRGLYKNAGA